MTIKRFEVANLCLCCRKKKIDKTNVNNRLIEIKAKGIKFDLVAILRSSVVNAQLHCNK